MTKYFLILAVFTVSLTPAVRGTAAPVQAGSVNFFAEAIQDITLLANTSLNAGNVNILLPDVSGRGAAGLVLGAQSGNTMEISSVVGWEFTGSDGRIGSSFRFGNIPPFSGTSYSGNITGITQNAADPGFDTGEFSSFQSGVATFGGSGFALEFLSGPFTGVVLQTDPLQSFEFTADLDGLPPSDQVVFTNSGEDQLRVLRGTELVGFSSNRRIAVTAVPEPASTAALIGLGGACWTGRRLRRRKATKI